MQCTKWDAVHDIPSTKELRMLAAVVAASGVRHPSVFLLLARAMEYCWGLWEQEMRHLNLHLQLNTALPSWLISSFRHAQRQELVLIHYRMPPPFGLLIGEGMNSFSRIRRLVLMDNSFGDEGVGGLSTGLRRDCQLREINLVRCHVGDVGAVALADALKSNKTLEVLELEENRIGDVGGAALADAIGQHNTTLAQLLLGGNFIGPHTAAQLQAAGSRCLVSMKSRFFGQLAGPPPPQAAHRYPPNEYRFTPGCFKLESPALPRKGKAMNHRT
jgi:hypothetical protein